MRAVKKDTKRVISLLLSGRLPASKKYAGRHVLVVKEKIIPLREGHEGIKDIEELEKEYAETPTIVFVPRQDISYILVVCQK